MGLHQAHGINKHLNSFLAQDSLMEEFGVNGAICDVVAKKPWLVSLMSFCSLASVSPMEMFVLQPLCLVQSRGCSLQRAQLHSDKTTWEAYIPYFLCTLSLAFWSHKSPTCPLYVFAAGYVFIVWDLLRCRFSGQRACCRSRVSRSWEVS